MPDPACGVDIRLSPTISQVDEEGTGRPARGEVTDLCRLKGLTGEESQFDLALEEVSPGQRSLGLLSAEKVAALHHKSIQFNSGQQSQQKYTNRNINKQ